MARKRKTLPENIQEIIDSGNLEAFQAVFDQCEIAAVKGRGTTQNIFSFINLKPAHILFLIEHGIDVNADAGFGHPPAAHQSYSKENLQCLIEHGADIDLTLKEIYGNALFRAARLHRPQDVQNLLECGASPHARGGWFGQSALDASLAECRNGDIVSTLAVSRLLLDAGAEKSEKTPELVRLIGENFEFMRQDFNPDYVEEFSDALQELYGLLDVLPVPQRTMHDSTSRITVTAKSWQKQHEELWNLLVPGKGAASTVQGELIRITGKLSYEILDNGGMNWDSDFRKMTRALADYIHMADGLEPSLTEEICRIAMHISRNTDETTLYRLSELAVAWVIANPDPLPLPEVSYKR